MLVVGSLVLAEYAFGVDLGIDHVLFPNLVGPHPGRPSPPTALAFVLLGAALLFFDARPAFASRTSEWLILGAALIALTAFLGQLFGEGPLYRWPRAPVIGVAVPTAASLLLTCIGLLAVRPKCGVARRDVVERGGTLLRRLVVAAVLVPALLGFGVSRLFAALGIEDTSLTSAALAAIMISVSLVLLNLTALPFESALEALRASRQRTQDLVEHASDGIFVADLEGRYTEVNAAGCQMLGFAREELIGKSIVDLLAPEDIPRLSQSKEELSKGHAQIDEWLLRRKDGSYLPVEVSAKILADGRWQGFVRDISERKRLEQALRLAEAKSSGILAISPDAIISVDERQRITLFNKGAEEIFGYSRDEMLGRPLDTLIPERVRAHHRDVVAQFGDGEVATRRVGERTLAISGLRKNGEEFPAEAAVSRLEVGGQRILTVALRDVTERRRLEEELRRAIHARDEVLSVVAHDLRNPLNSIGLQAQLLRRRKDADDDLRGALSLIDRAAKRMLRLIQDLLDVARTEAGELTLERRALPTRKIVEDCAEAQRELCANATIDLALDLDARLPDVWAD